MVGPRTDLTPTGQKPAVRRVSDAGCGHDGGDYTYKVILHCYDLADPVLWRIAAIMHEVDLEDDHYDAPEAAGFDLILRVLEMANTDEEVLSMTTQIFDAV